MKRAGGVGLFLAAALCYAAVSPRHPVGYFNDDTLNIALAESLLHGRFVHAYKPVPDPVRDPLPGYPLFLAPLVGIVQPQWAALKASTAALLLLSGALLLAVFRGLVPGPALGLAVALFLFNPTTVELSGAVLPDPFFLCALLGVTALFRRVLDRPGEAWGPWVLGAAGAGLALIRPQGILLDGVFFLGLWTFARHARAAWFFAAVVLPSFLLQSLMGWGAGYWGVWRAAGGGTSLDLAAPLTHAAAVADTVGRELLLGPLDGVWGTGAALLVALGIGFGGRQILRKGAPVLRALAGTVLGIVAALVLLPLFWPVALPRYFFPLLPFLLVFFGAGVHGLWTGGGVRGRAAAALGVLILAGAASASLARAWGDARNPRRPSVPLETQEWIRRHTGSAEVVWSFSPPTVYLYTGRRGEFFVPENSPEAFRSQLLAAGATLAMHQPLLHPFVNAEANARWQRAADGLSAWPEAFEVLYRNPREGTLVCRVVNDPGYRRGYDLYRSALADLPTDRWEDGLKKLNDALTLVPTLAPALNAYGVTLMLKGRDLPFAERVLERAVALSPSSQYQKNLDILRAMRRREGR